jgi:DNA repair protein RecO (recombination protein O)
MLLTTKGIVLSKKKLEDNDALITVLTENSGKVKAIAKGAKTSRSMIAATTQPFTHGEFLFDLGAAWNRVRSVEVLEPFRHIQEDLLTMGYGAYFLELAAHLAPEDGESKGLYKILTETLKCLNQNGLETDLPWLKVIFEFKALSASGYQLQLGKCVRCNASGPHTALNIEEGGAICVSCIHQEDDEIGQMLFNIMDYIHKQSIEILSGTKINRLYVGKLDILSIRFMKYHVGFYQSKSLDFLKAIRKV